MTTRRGRVIVALATVAGLATAAGCTGTEGVTGDPPAPTVELTDVRLVSHGSCDELLDWFHTEAATRVGPYGFAETGYLTSRGATDDAAASSFAAESAASAPGADGGSTASGSTGASSTTNTQEPGVGEPDLAWTDGTRLATIVNQSLQVVDLQAGTVTADVDLAPEDGGWTTPTGLLVDGDHALVIQSSSPYSTYEGPVASVQGGDAFFPDGTSPTTVLTRVDLGGTPTVVGSVTVDGSYVDARMVDGVARTVVRSTPTDLGFVYPSGSGRSAVERATAINRQVVEDSTIDDWLPTMTVAAEGREGSPGPAVDCAAVDHPASFGGFGVVTVLGLDLGDGSLDPMPAAAVVADAQTVYASTDGLYVATTATIDPADPTVRTEVHAFSLPRDAAARYEASGAVPGTLIGQFALSELDGDLRVATTTDPGMWSGPMPIEDGAASAPSASVSRPPTTSESRITVLRPDGEELRRVGGVTGLGPTEQIRGVRFAGPTAYVVTFRQTDPLYVVDLSDPTAPRTAGELKIPGYSSYLQVLDEGRVLGIGQDATDRGRTTGFQQSLFDVSDPGDPSRLAQLVVPDATSLAEDDHHALLWWPDARLLAVPVERWSGRTSEGGDRSGILVTHVDDTAITEVGTITHPGGGGGTVPCPPGAYCAQPVGGQTPIVRTLVADGRLVTVSSAGVKVSDLTSLADLGWIPLR